ncbi:MAG: DUF481 domain-containing protein, partial [Candidatus Hinthialibacter sp.]
MKNRLLFWTAASLLFTSTAFSDRVSMKDGSIIVGDILQMVDGGILIHTSFAGDITFPMEEVVAIETVEAKPVYLNDGSVIQGTIEMKAPGEMEIVRQEDETGFTIGAADILAINPPPPPPPEKPKWEGEIIGTLSITSGNSETKAVGFSTNLRRRTEDDRINLRGGYFYAEDDGEGTRDDQFIFGKYDYFFTDQFFGYLSSRLDRDVIRDLDLRMTGGAGLGYQFIENDIHNLFGEAGLSYVNEDFGSDSDDQSYVAGRIALHYGWWIIPDRLQFTEDAEVYLGIEDLDDWFGISETALMWKWTDRWSANAG